MVRGRQAQVEQQGKVTNVTGSTSELVPGSSRTHRSSLTTDFAADLNQLTPAVYPLLDDDLAPILIGPAWSYEHRPLPVMPLHNRDTGVPAPIGPPFSPIRNRTPIVATGFTMLIPMLGAPVGATRKPPFTIVGNPSMGAVVISADGDVHLCRLSGTSEGKSSYSSKRNPSQTEAHQKPPDRGGTLS